MKQLGNSLLLLTVLSLSACTWVKVSEQGEKVRVLSASEVTGCKRVGKTNVNTTSSVAFVDRYPDKVQEELDTLARNSAPKIGGDTVVRVGKPVKGSQVYDVYHCMPN